MRIYGTDELEQLLGLCNPEDEAPIVMPKPHPADSMEEVKLPDAWIARFGRELLQTPAPDMGKSELPIHSIKDIVIDGTDDIMGMRRRELPEYAPAQPALPELAASGEEIDIDLPTNTGSASTPADATPPALQELKSFYENIRDGKSIGVDNLLKTLDPSGVLVAEAFEGNTDDTPMENFEKRKQELAVRLLEEKFGGMYGQKYVKDVRKTVKGNEILDFTNPVTVSLKPYSA